MASCKSSGGTQYCYLQFEKKMFATLSKLSDLHLGMYTYQIPDILGFCFYSDSLIFFHRSHDPFYHGSDASGFRHGPATDNSLRILTNLACKGFWTIGSKKN